MFLKAIIIVSEIWIWNLEWVIFNWCFIQRKQIRN